MLNLRLGVFGLLVHDVEDHAAGSRAALRGGVDADRLLGSACVLFTMNVDPVKAENNQCLHDFTLPGLSFGVRVTHTHSRH